MADVMASVPEEFLAVTGGPEGAQLEIKRLVVLDLVRRGTMSAGRGAEILGIRIDEFAKLMGEHGMPWFDYSPEELDEDLKTLRDLR